MHLARRAWCRTYQMVFRIALPVLPYTEPHILEHAEDVPAVLQKRSIQRVLIVTDPGIARLGLTAPLETALASKGIGVAIYAKTSANPTVSNVEEAASLYRENACQAVIGFGGGSAMDCAKGVGARIAQPNKPINKMHGLANAIILPHMLRAYGDAAAPKLADLARMADIAPATAQDGLAAEAFIDWVDRMNVALGIPKYVTGIRRSDIPEMAMHADAEANPLYPVPLLMDRLELERMYEVVAGGMFEGEN